jgi:hypothetical protein
MRTWDSFCTIFGVVPEETIACMPERAPQATVMKRNGKSVPAKTGPFVLEANSVTAGISTRGRTTTIPSARTTIVPIFMKVDR